MSAKTLEELYHEVETVGLKPEVVILETKENYENIKKWIQENENSDTSDNFVYSRMFQDQRD